MDKKVSVKKASGIDAANAYTVTVTEIWHSGNEITVYDVHTGPNGTGLWVDGKQVEGHSQFRVGKNPAAAIRRYFN